MDFLQKFNFYKTEVDHGLFILANKTIFIAVYVNHLLLFSVDIDPQIDDVIQNLRDKLWIINLSEVSYHLGMKIDVYLGKKTITLQ